LLPDEKFLADNKRGRRGFLACKQLQAQALKARKEKGRKP
jgi:hypothetical protein